MTQDTSERVIGRVVGITLLHVGRQTIQKSGKGIKVSLSSVIFEAECQEVNAELRSFLPYFVAYEFRYKAFPACPPPNAGHQK